METDLAKGWLITSIGAVCSIHDSKRVPLNASERKSRIQGKTKEELFPYYGATGEAGKIDDYRFDGEYVLLGEDAAPFLEPHKGVAYLVNGKFWVNNHAHILRLSSSNKFLCYCLTQTDYKPYVTGTTRLKLNQGRLKEIPFPLPPLNEQKRIVAKIEELFSEIDAGVASLRQARAQLGVYRQSLLKQAFEGKLTEKWRSDNLPAGQASPDQIEPAEQLLERIRQEREARYQQQLNDWQTAVKEWEAKGKEGKKPAKPREPKAVQPFSNEKINDLSGLPEKWLWCKVGDLSIAGTGVTPLKARADFYENGKVPWITSTVVNADYVRKPNSFVTDQALAETSLKIYPVGSLIIALYGEGKTRGKVSELCFETTVNQALVVLVQSGLEAETRPFLKLFLLKNYIDVRRLSSGGVQPNLNMSIVENTAVPLCSLSEQKEIVRILEAQFTAIEQNEREIDGALERSEALRQSILKKAFSGQLVPPACRQAGKIPLELPEPEQGKWWVYVLECDDGSFYKGFTDNLPRRWKQHQAGTAAKWTKQHPPKSVFYYEEHWSEAAALSREKYLKSGSGREWFRDEIVAKPEEYEPASVLLERIRAERAAEAVLKAKKKVAKTTTENVPLRK